ncbi:hypothetical protein BDW22DRAFT_460940 [Trametopsis cervina]|nr:hypothetical protein BDW22DRAFT_460940 [Trametopsis cervina]
MCCWSRHGGERAASPSRRLTLPAACLPNSPNTSATGSYRSNLECGLKCPVCTRYRQLYPADPLSTAPTKAKCDRDQTRRRDDEQADASEEIRDWRRTAQPFSCSAWLPHEDPVRRAYRPLVIDVRFILAVSCRPTSAARKCFQIGCSTFFTPYADMCNFAASEVFLELDSKNDRPATLDQKPSEMVPLL